MNIKTTMSISEARKKIYQIADAVQKPDHYYVLTEKGIPKAVIMSAEQFESWAETLEVIKDFPDLAQELKDADEEYKRGEYIPFEKILAEEGYVIQNSSSSQGKKRPAKNR